MSFPKLQNFNDIYTPPEAVDIIAKYLPKDKIYWEACYGEGHFASRLKQLGFNVVGYKELDCLTCQPIQRDVFITNPPFNGNKKFLKRAIELGKPFVLLLRLEHLGGVEASKLLKGLPITVIVPEKRINYISKTLKGRGSPFHSVFLCYGLRTKEGFIYD